MTAGVVAAVVAPIVTAVGALANEWSIEVEHRDDPPTDEVTVVEDK